MRLGGPPLRSGRSVGGLAFGLIGLLSLIGGIGCANSRVRPGGSLPSHSVASVGDETISRTSGDPGESVEVVGARPFRKASTGHGALVGRVFDDDGRPVAGATIRPALGASKQGRDISAKTDDAGQFVLANLPLGSEWTLIAEPPGDDAKPGRILVRVPNDRVRIHLPPPDPFARRDEREIHLQRVGATAPIPDEGGSDWSDVPADDENPLPPAREPEGSQRGDTAGPSSDNPAAWGLPPGNRQRLRSDEASTRDIPPHAGPRPAAIPETEAGRLKADRGPERPASANDDRGNPAPDRDDRGNANDDPPASAPAQWGDLDWGAGSGSGSEAPKSSASATPAPRAATFAEATCRFDPSASRVVDFQLPDLDGKPFRFGEIDAQVILLDLWGSWCPPCRASIPHLIALQDRYKADGLQIVGVAYEEGTLAQGARTAGGHARSAGVNYPIVLGREADCPLRTALQVEAFPTLVLLDRSGRILWRGQGANPDTLKALDRAVAEALGQTR